MDDLRTCPFDPSHRVAVLKLPNHIVKCQRNHPDVQTKVCPYNATHILRIPEYQNHKYTCPDSKMLFSTQVTETEDYLVLPKTSSSSISPPTNENWEDEFVTESVLEAIQKKPPARFMDAAKLSGMKPSLKKEYYNSLSASGSNSDCLEAKKEEIEATAMHIKPELKKLRLPVVDPEVAALQALNRGRGVLAGVPRPVERPGRIAANIFSHGEQQNLRWKGGPKTVGIGRGRGVFTQTLDKTSIPNGYIHSKAETTKSMKEVNNHYTSTDSERSSDYSDQKITDAQILKEKEIKKQLKKLNQIIILEERLKNNVKLNDEELKKISEREDVEELLQKLRLKD